MPRASTTVRRLVVLLALACLVGNVGFLFRSLLSGSSLWSLSSSFAPSEPFSLAAFYRDVPYSPSWRSWWHPQRPLQSFRDVIDHDWNLLHHLGGYGPWVERESQDGHGSIAPPSNCEVEQVHMMSRHAERYPTKKAGQRMLDLVDKIKRSGVTFQKELAFVNDWTFFSSDPSRDFEQLTTTGPYAGTLEAFATGSKLRTRYSHLLPEIKKRYSVWASDSRRVIETSKYFSAAFFGLPLEENVQIHIIPETSELGGDTLTPGDTCSRYSSDLDKGHDYGNNMLVKFRATYLSKIGHRLEKQNPGIRFTDSDIWSMQEMCGFETIIRGSSDWCSVFSHDEWRSFEYARDIVHYYRGGPGNPYGKAMGWLWLNATRNLLMQGPEAGPLFFSFVHDGDIAPMLAALDLFPDKNHLPVTGKIPHDRNWKTSEITPMGARIIFERLSCAVSRRKPREIFMRINVNDGSVPIWDCNHGPGGSCPLADFDKLIDARGVKAGDFREVCGLDQSAAPAITFLHQ